MPVVSACFSCVPMAVPRMVSFSAARLPLHRCRPNLPTAAAEPGALSQQAWARSETGLILGDPDREVAQAPDGGGLRYFYGCGRDLNNARRRLHDVLQRCAASDVPRRSGDPAGPQPRCPAPSSPKQPDSPAAASATRTVLADRVRSRSPRTACVSVWCRACTGTAIRPSWDQRVYIRAPGGPPCRHRRNQGVGLPCRGR